MKKIQRGDIFYADLNPAIGSEQGGIRPVIVVQNDVGNYYSPTIIVTVLTTKLKKHLPTHIDIRAGDGNIASDSTILLEQLRTIDKNRLKQYIGNVSENIMDKIDRGMLISLGISGK